ncbi:hypothetical protein MTBPR1_140064 [Candidatus Terasakiella magnetica]|uniref:ParB/Sulfiredoxin domain-containing protein n=1 Tax=Candidatus Terasakiella magnetica TaxID=1867952 RepID=A0A1C3RF75_9PROT|nr:hypothetical protein [Candidatus Terasakiella magnetica]SCA55946.1 hypothetical protein MTBPR1_140064 [Candidatus Terasakiella magnetica]
MDEDASDDVTQLMKKYKLTPLEAMRGQKGEKELKTILDRREVGKTSHQWKEKDFSSLNPFDFSWDLNPDNFHYAQDGVSEADFKKKFPDCQIAYADTVEIADNLFKHSTRGGQKPWEGNYASSTANIIDRCYRNWPITPPQFHLHNHEIIISGGHHRFHIALEKGDVRIPFIYETAHKNDFVSLLKSFNESK